MRLTKLAFLITACTFFIMSCQKTDNTDQTTNADASMTPTPSSSSAVLTGSPAEARSASASPSPAAPPAISPKASPSAPPTPRRTPPPAANAAVNAAVDLASARTIYQRDCAACHGRGGEGNPNGAPGLKGVGGTDQQLAGKIAKGGGGMPAYKGRLTQHQITGLVRLIRQGF